MKTWVKLYTELNRDPKMAPFTWAQKGIWAALLALAGELDIRNGHGIETGELQSIEDIAWSIRCDISELTEAVQAFSRPAKGQTRGMLYEQDGVLFMTNYPKRQARPPSARPEATRERKRRQRARDAQAQRQEDVSLARHDPSQPVTLSESESETETDTESDQNQTRLVTETQRAIANRTGLRPISDLIPSLSVPDSDLTPKRAPPQTDAARIEYAIQIRERAERRKLPGREETQMRQWANEYGAAALYEATRRTAFKRPDNFGGYLRKTLEQIGQARGPP